MRFGPMTAVDFMIIPLEKMAPCMVQSEIMTSVHVAKDSGVEIGFENVDLLMYIPEAAAALVVAVSTTLIEDNRLFTMVESIMVLYV